jgi:tetratricopeptide (TPR) repeat protein
VQRLPLQVALLGVLAYSNSWRTRGGAELEAELVARIAECELEGLAEVAAAGFHTLSFVQYETGKLDSAMTSSLSSIKRGSSVDVRSQAGSLAWAARCLAMVERDMPRAQDLLGQAIELLGVDDSEHRLEIHWASGMLHRFVGRREDAVAGLERALQLARHAQNRWAQFECLMILTRMDLEEMQPATALTRCQEMSEVARRMSEGSELTIATALEALTRTLLHEPGGEERLATAIAALRRIDAKGALAFVLVVWARADLEAGRLDRAKAHAMEAVSAAEILKRRSDAAVAQAVLGLVVLAMGDREGAMAQLRAASTDASEPLVLSAHARARARALADALEVTLRTT